MQRRINFAHVSSSVCACGCLKNDEDVLLMTIKKQVTQKSSWSINDGTWFDFHEIGHIVDKEKAGLR